MFKDTKGYQQSPVEQYFNRNKADLSISQVAEYIQETPTGMYAREPIAYAFKKVAMELGHQEPVQFNQLSFEPVRVPFNTNYVYDNTLPLTMEEVRQEGVDRLYTGRFEVPMYGKVTLGNRIEIDQYINEEGADEIIAIGTKPWVNILMPIHVSPTFGARILLNGRVKDPQAVTDLTVPLELEQYLSIDAPGFKVDNVPFVEEGKYTISFEYQIIGGGVEDIDYDALFYNEGNTYVDGELKGNYGNLKSSEWPLTNGKHTFYLHFTGNSGESSFIWQFNKTVPDGEGEVWITKLNIHEGHVHPFRENLELLPIQGTVWQNRTRTEVIPFQTTTVEKPELFPSQSRVEVAGKTGSRTYTWTVEVVDGVETGNQTPEVETEYVAPVNQVYWQGIKEGSPITEINIADYGAVYNNPNHDNKALIHQAMDELVDVNGGGTILFPSNGELYVSENIMMRENITFQGIGNKPTIKLMPNISNFWSMIHMDTKKNMKIDNLTIDSNKAGRTNNLGDLSVMPQIIISMANESENIDITNNKIVGNGVWLVACHTGGIHPKNIKVNNNELFWSMGYSTPDKEFVNGVTVDNTWVYFDAIGYEFIGNTLDSDTPIANMTAIEAHGANGIVRDNTVSNARTGIIPWNMVNNEMSIDNNILVEDNEFIDVLNGVDVGLSPTRNFKGLIIRRNSFHLKPSNFTGAVFSRGIILGAWNAVNGEFSEDFEIYENTITSENYQLPHTDSGAYYNYYGIGVGSGVYKNLMIRDNVIDGVPSFGLMVQNEAFKTVEIQSGTIIGNTIKNSGKSLSNRGGTVISAIHVASRVDTKTYGLTVDINDIIDERSTTETWYTQPTLMPNAPRFMEQNITEAKLPLQMVVVYDSSVDGITFETTPNPVNIYVHTTHVRLTAGKQYVIETDIPLNGTRKNLFVSDVNNTPLKASVGIGEMIDVPLSAEGYTYVSARPLKDPDTQSLEPYNYSHFNDGTYKIIISEVI